MDLLQLQYFCHAAKTQSFSRTAEAFQVPMTSVSQCVRRLEAELGVSLFNRKANRIVLNTQGQEFFSRVESALSLLDEAKTIAQTTEESGTLRVGLYINRTHLMQVVKIFREEYPRVEILLGSTSPRLTENISDYDILVSPQNVPEGFSSELVFTDRLCLAAAKGMLPEDRPLSVDNLRELDFITLSPGSLSHDNTIEVGNRLGFSPKIIMQARTIRPILECVAHEIGVTILQYRVWRETLPDNVVFHDIGDFPLNTYLCQRNKRYIPKYQQRFYQLLSETFARMREEKN